MDLFRNSKKGIIFASSSQVRKNKKWDRTGFLLFCIACSFMIFMSSYSYFAYKPVAGTDLIKINGTLEKLYFRETLKSRDLIVNLKEYPVNFYLWSGNLRVLDKQIKSVRKGEKIYLFILNTKKEDLNKLKTIEIYSFSTSNHEYLKLDDINRNQFKNVRVGLWMGFVFVGLLVLLIMGYLGL